MMHRLTVSFSVLLLALAAGAASATTMVLASDEDLFDQAVLVLEGTVRSASLAPSGIPATEYRVRVDRSFKGQAPGGEVLVRVPGGAGADGMKLEVWGAPELKSGERTLLFLGRYDDGAFGPLHLAMGAFREVRFGGRRLALRDLSEMEDVSKAFPEPDRARDFDRFADWLEDRARNLKRPADYFSPLAGSDLERLHEKFTHLAGIRQRWVEFDDGESIGWRAHVSGQPGSPVAGFAQFQRGIAVWNGDPDTNIRYRYDGTTTSREGFTEFDGINAILFNDVNNEVTGTFQCSSPGVGFGVLALGGTWTVQNQPEPRAIAGADIIINDGAGCWFSSARRAEQVYAHELGHTLGLGHSCGDSRSGLCDTVLKDQALMRASAHVDERGARLNGDDRAGIRNLYGTGPVPSPPAAPSGLTAEPVSETVIRLEWRDNSNNETEFLIERSSPAGGFSLVATVPAGTTEHEVSGLTPGTPYTFRVRARNAQGTSSFSNMASATTSDGEGPCAAGAETLCLAGGRFAVEVHWRTGETNGTGKVVPNSDQTGMVWFFDASNIELIVKVLDGRPVNGAFWVFYGGLSDVEYWITVTDSQTGRSRTYHNERGNLCGKADTSAFPETSGAAAVAALEQPEEVLSLAAAVPCAADPETLCLFGGRFQVKVSWRLGDDTEGTGKAVPLAGTDRTGLFWFFDPANIELVVKMIDGTPLNGKLWFFYGALSDVEYEIEVLDTQTGATRTYRNPAGNLCGQGDTAAFSP
jgi:hypothetical protein